MWSIFDQYADRYDTWFERMPGQEIFRLELAGLKRALKGAPRPWLEVGVGTGRFAKKLAVDEGVDPAAAVLEHAKKRGIKVTQAPAEALPFPDASFGTLLLIITLCFLDKPEVGLSECYRVLCDDGRLILGMIPADSPWGRYYLKRKEAGHIFYSQATFYTVTEASSMLESQGFRIECGYSTLFDLPGSKNYPFVLPKEGILPGASFVTLRAIKEVI